MSGPRGRQSAPTPAFDGGGRHYVEGSIKTAASDRTIPIPRWLCEDLAGVLAERVRNQGRPARPDEHLFLNLSGRPLNRDPFRALVVRSALRAAGLPDSFRTYDFRHTHASMLIDDGANLLAVAHRMGHTDPAIEGSAGLKQPT